MTLWARNLLFESMPFSASGSNKWEDSDIRHFLNNKEFVERFEPSFRKLLSMVYKDNGEDPETFDVFFLLSKEELEGGYEFIKTEADRVKTDKDGENRYVMPENSKIVYKVSKDVITNMITVSDSDN